jgi:hypothetical protein
LDYFGFCFPDIIFDLNLQKLVPTTFLGRKKIISFNKMLEKRRVNWMIVVLLKEWKGVGVVLGA